MKTKKNHKLHKEAGFTLTELTMVIVILGILGAMGGDFIAEMFRGFRATNSRLEMYEEAKTALFRMERELHIMIPNGVCVTADLGGTCVADGSPAPEIRFGMILEDTMRNNNLSGGYTQQPVDFPLTAPATLTDMNGGATPPTGGIVSVYNTSWATFAGGSRLFSVSATAGSDMIFGGQTISDYSPQSRYFLVDRGVSYRYDNGSGTLFRKVTGVSSAGLASFGSAVEYPLLQNITDFRFYYAAPSLSRNGIISLVFTLSRDGNTLQMHKEIHVKNVP